MFGERLKKLRVREGLYQKELGEILGLTEGAVGMYEIGKRKPDFEILNKIADYFNVTTDYLLGRTDEENTAIIEENEIPKELRDVGVEYLEVSKEFKEKGFSAEDIREILEFADIVRKKK